MSLATSGSRRVESKPNRSATAPGRSRGGRTTKVHLASEQGRKALSLVLTAGPGSGPAVATGPVYVVSGPVRRIR
ncbi:hypothetical protein GCM10020218_049810 [Dactylosporangium vinaceum]